MALWKNNSVGSSEHFFPSHWWIQISMSYFFHTPSSFLVYSMSKIMTCCFQKKHTSFLPWHMTCLIYGYFSPSLVDTWRVAPIHYEKIFYLKIYHLQNRFSLEFVSWHVTSKRATVSCCSPSRRYWRTLDTRLDVYMTSFSTEQWALFANCKQRFRKVNRWIH